MHHTQSIPKIPTAAHKRIIIFTRCFFLETSKWKRSSFWEFGTYRISFDIDESKPSSSQLITGWIILEHLLEMFHSYVRFTVLLFFLSVKYTFFNLGFMFLKIARLKWIYIFAELSLMVHNNTNLPVFSVFCNVCANYKE